MRGERSEPSAQPLGERNDEGKTPWKEADEEDGRVEIPDVPSGVFGDRRTQKVVHTEEAYDEIHAVQRIHSCIPDTAHEGKEKNPERFHPAGARRGRGARGGKAR